MDNLITQAFLTAVFFYLILFVITLVTNVYNSFQASDYYFNSYSGDHAWSLDCSELRNIYTGEFIELEEGDYFSDSDKNIFEKLSRNSSLEGNN